MALEDLIGKVPAKFVAGAFVSFVAIFALLTGYALYAWHTDDTLTLAGYEFGRPSVGAGAVVAYDTDGCPSGWAPFKAATARFIIGAGGADYFDDAYREGADGEPLSAKARLVPGGSESHKLKIEEMPEHEHKFQVKENVLDNPDFFLGEVGTEYVFEPSQQGETRPRARIGGERVKIASRGNNVPHNNMPPYIALYFCKKEG